MLGREEGEGATVFPLPDATRWLQHAISSHLLHTTEMKTRIFPKCDKSLLSCLRKFVCQWNLVKQKFNNDSWVYHWIPMETMFSYQFLGHLDLPGSQLTVKISQPISLSQPTFCTVRYFIDIAERNT